jgi:hypothetical protein
MFISTPYYLRYHGIEASDNKYFLCTGISEHIEWKENKRLPAAPRKWRNVSGFLTVRANTADTGCRPVDLFAEIAKWRVAMRGGMIDGS